MDRLFEFERSGTACQGSAQWPPSPTGGVAVAHDTPSSTYPPPKRGDEPVVSPSSESHNAPAPFPRRREIDLARQNHHGEQRRIGHRMVRLLHLRNGRRAGLQHLVLPGIRPSGRHPAGFHDVRHRIRGASAGRDRLRALRRPGGPQARAGDGPVPDGRLHDADRAAADVRRHRSGRPRAARRPAPAAGHRRGRPVGRSRADRHRERPAGAAWPVRQFRAAGSAGRADAVQPGLPRHHVHARRTAVHLVGLAGAVPVQHRPGPGRALRPVQA